MIGGLVMMLLGAVLLYVAVINAKWADVAQGFLNGSIIKRKLR